MRKAILISSALLLLFAMHAVAQDSSSQPAPKLPEPPANFYRLQFVVQELNADGKPTNSRTYVTTVRTTDSDKSSSIRTNSRVPVITGSTGSSGAKNTEIQYIDVGVNIDARHAHELGRQLSLELSVDVSSIASPSEPDLHPPVIRQNKWQAVALVPVGKPTVVFTSDTLDSKGSMQLVLTATPIE